MPDFLDKFKAGMERKTRRVAPPVRRTKRLYDRCTTIHDGQRITFDLSTARTCPPGFFGLKNGGGVRVVNIEKTSKPASRKTTKKTAARKTTKKKTTKKKTTKKTAARKTTKKANGSSPAAVRERIKKLYSQRKLGEASKLRAKLRAMGYEYK